MFWETLIEKAFSLTSNSYPYDFRPQMCCYIVDGKIVAAGYIMWSMQIKEKWFITFSNYISPEGSFFQKLLYHYNDEEKRQLNRCHAYYIDNEDLDKGGGTGSEFTWDETIASLIDHGERFDESNCEFCRGEGKFQTHMIGMFEPFKFRELIK